MAQDNSIALQGEVSTFFMRQNDLSDSLHFAGLFGYSIVDSLTKNLGDNNPLQVPSLTQSNKFDLIRVIRSAPDLGEFTINERIKRQARGMLERTVKQLCEYYFVIRLGACSRPDDLSQWDSLILVLGATPGGDFDAGTLQQFDDNEALEFNLTYNHLDWDRIFTTSLGEKADSILLTEVLDIIYADAQSCGSCAPFSNGCQAIYALTNNRPSSPGLSSQIVYTLNLGDWNAVDIATLGGASADALTAVGQYLVVVSESDAAHHYSLKSGVSAASWVKVTTGYESGGEPRRIFGFAPALTFIGGAGGYLYKMTDVAAGVTVIHDASETTEDCNAIDANGQVVLTGHDNNDMLISFNLGTSFSLVEGPVPGVNVNTVQIVSPTQFYAGMNDGTLWYGNLQTDGTVDWVQRAVDGTLTDIQDMAFSPDFPMVGALVGNTASASYVYRTYDGGRSWSRQAPVIRNLSTAPLRYNAVALCGTGDIAAAGVKVGGADGIIAVGTDSD